MLNLLIFQLPDIVLQLTGKIVASHHLDRYPLSSVNYLVFDRADNSFQNGFAEQIKEMH